ncbi:MULTISPECIES: TonB-dependent hemoglobin/transferrin/lactoferrin family receptor [Photorhabdus]|uniref:Outer membrane heme/hemoglobin receptor (Heme utilization/transpor protein) n=2 Tax=Photorhabdus asymbiotica TaxID=291112 RepID=C7BHP4_PHOAA|nr:TonB-dependent hemoglobin/transferrin/lactoferrin family receptor [Photorhabdus asymbiotica]RKS66113.1 hemoglobin/transferrin/lactoferrin receptor protein [Photorhabdus asymbiotica]CAQ83991.1 outer membrane heme/hemoglobin receptor (heme utilization/transpor protein) [Photorhabdus asymbiotica]
MSQSAKSTLKLSALSLAIISSIPTVYAATKSPDSESDKSSHDVITVYATGNERDSFEAPMMVTVINNKSPQSQTAGNANDLIRKIPGINIAGTNRANGQDISLRGYGPQGVLTLIDGIRQGTDTGHINGTFLDPALIKQVEVVRGPSALLYGSGALGGVVAYQTVDAEDLLQAGQNHGFRVFARGATGDHSIGFGGATFGKTESLDGLFAFSTRDAGNIRNSNGLTADNDEFISNLIAKGSWKINENQSLSSQLRYYRNEAKQPKNPQMLIGKNEKPDSWSDRTTTQRDAQLSYQLNPAEYDWLNAKANLYYSDITIDARTKEKGFEGRKQKTYGVKLENRSRLWTDSPLAHQFTYGGETYQQKQTPGGNTDSFPDADIRFSSGWVQDEITLRDLPISIIAGTRYDNYKGTNSKYKDVNADKWSSKGAISITPTDWSMLFTSYAQAFRAPTMKEMYNDSRHYPMGPGMNNYWIPNPNLRPESNETWESGFGLRFDNLLAENDELKFKASYFDTKAKDYIKLELTNPLKTKSGEIVKSRSGDPIYLNTTSTNVPSAKIWGWDISMNYESSLFSWELAYNRTEGKDEKSGYSLNNLSPDTITSILDIPIAQTGFSVGWISQFTNHTDFKGKDDKGNDLKQQAGYGINDFYVSYQGEGMLKGVTTTAVLGNAFDKEYYSPQGVPQDGRNAKLLVSYQW